MTLTFSELHDSGEGTDFGVDAVRRFRVPGYTENTALTHASLPAVGSVHPRISGLYAQTKRTTGRIADQGWYVDVGYGRAILGSWGAAQTEPPPLTELGYKQSNYTSVLTEIQVPFVAVLQVLPPLAPGAVGPPVPEDVYLPEFRQMRIGQGIYKVRMNLASISLAQIQTIDGQKGKIHEFGSQKWLFMGATIDQRDSQGFHLQYEWLSDPGNAGWKVTPAGDELQLPTAGNVTYLEIPARAPFQAYNIATDETDGTQSIIVVNTAVENLTGHTTLPGTPIA